MSLLHDVFRPPQAELDAMRSGLRNELAVPAVEGVAGEGLLRRERSRSPEEESSSDEEVGVVSHSTTPSRTRAPSPSRPPAGALSRPAPKPLLITSSKTDPFRRLNTELVIRILGMLEVGELKVVSEVCRKWGRSQAANFVWFRHARQGNFHDDSHLLPTITSTTPTWTKKQSKQNWRLEYRSLVLSRRTDPPPLPPLSSSRPSSRASSPLSTGYQTPREMKEEMWAREADGRERLSKNEMRELYKELGGRKAKGKGVWDKQGSGRDRTGWVEGDL